MEITTLELIGDGNGDGYGYGDGSDSIVYTYAIASEYSEDGYIPCVWRCDEHGAPSNGGHGSKAEVGKVETITGPLEICTANGLHGTLRPSEWNGSHWWVVLLKEPVQVKGDKLASLERKYIKNLGKCPF